MRNSLPKPILFVVFHFFFLYYCGAQVVFRGNVFDADTKEPLIGASVLAGNAAGITDDHGVFEFSLPTSGVYPVTVKFIGYGNFTVEENIQSVSSKSFVYYLKSGNQALQTLTVTSGKFEKALGEVTVSMDVIKPELIANTNTQSVDNVLQKVPGVTIIDGQANIRGGSGYSYGAGSRVLLLIDDIPALQSDAGLPNWRDVAVENIEQIEVVKGAASALYGSSAMNGIINIRTGFAKATPETKVSFFEQVYFPPKDPLKKWPGWNPNQTGGTLLHKQRFGKLDFVGSLYYINNNSFIKDAYDKVGRGTLGLRYRFTDKLSVGATLNYNTGSSQSFFYWANGGAGAYTGDSSTVVSTKKTRYTLDANLNYFDDAGSRHKILGRYYFIDNGVFGGKSNNSKLYYGEYQFQHKFEQNNLVLTAGLVAQATTATAQLYGDTSYASNNLAAYLQLDKKVFNKLNLSLGVRYEQNNLTAPEHIRIGPNEVDTIPNGKISESKPVVRIGANYQIAQATYLRASWGQGYRFPTIAELFITTNTGVIDVVANPKLTSETGWSSEIGIKQGFRVGGVQGYFDGALFWSEYFNMLEFALSPTQFLKFQSQNVGNITIKGFEASVVGTGKSGSWTHSFLAGYTYIDPEFQDFTDQVKASTSSGTNVLKYRYKHNVKLDYEIGYRSWSVGVSAFYNSNMENIDKIFEVFIPGLQQYRADHHDGFAVADLRIAYRPLTKLKLSAILGNIFNMEYQFRPALMEAPRNATLRVDYAF